MERKRATLCHQNKDNKRTNQYVNEGDGTVYNGLTSWNRFELRIYRLLGINKFRKGILLFEKIKHHKDNRKNENYHPSNFNVLALGQFNVFLLYNALLHSISLVFCGVYLLFTLAFGVRIIVVDVFMVILSLLNVFCILLQRNNHLQLKNYCYRNYKRFYNKVDLCNKDMLQKIAAQDSYQLYADYKVICRIKNAYEGRTDCVLSDSDTDSLRRICEYVEPNLQKKSVRMSKEVEEVGLIERCNSISGPYTALQKKADWLQRKFCLSGRKMLDYTVIITEGAVCEMFFRKLAPEGSANNVYLICLMLDEALAGVIDKVKANEA